MNNNQNLQNLATLLQLAQKPNILNVSTNSSSPAAVAHQTSLNVN